jgi:hypothetical protein
MSGLAKVATLATGLLTAGCSIFGIRSGTAEPAYSVVGQIGPVQLRQYGPRIAAETVVDAGEEAARTKGFERLAGYIFGGNAGHASIAMTAPVEQRPGERIAMTAPVGQARDAAGGFVVQFFMPAGSTLATLPKPDDPQVHLVSVPAQTMAVLRFTDGRGPADVAAKQAALLRRLQNTPWQPVGQPVAWFYDPPWTLPFLRRNEVAVPVEPKPAQQ